MMASLERGNHKLLRLSCRLFVPGSCPNAETARSDVVSYNFYGKIIMQVCLGQPSSCSFIRHENQLLEYLENLLTKTKCYTDIQTDIVYSRTGYDVIIYFRSEVIGKIPPLTTSGGISLRIMKVYALIEDNRPHTSRNDVTSCFRSTFIEIRKTVENAASHGFVCVKYNTVLHYAVSKASSNVSHEEYRQRLLLKLRGVSPTPPYGGLLVADYWAADAIAQAAY